MSEILGVWNHPVRIAENHFVYKSLSDWSLNVAVGCNHACRFCYVPDVATIKQGKELATFGVEDPDSEWGDYVLVRKWDKQCFIASLRRAENTPRAKLTKDGNRAVMLCTTTDPYQVLKGEAGAQLGQIVRDSLELILNESTLNVRILTRSPLARKDFDLMAKFGNRLLFGMSLPTMDIRMAKVYEPKAPSPVKRFDTLKAAKDAGLNVYVAMAPTYPELMNDDLAQTMYQIATLAPATVFHEPINIRAKNVERISKHAESIGVTLNTGVWKSAQAWADYSMQQMESIEEVAREFGTKECLHLWPDKELLKYFPNQKPWFESYWHRVSEWPGKADI